MLYSLFFIPVPRTVRSVQWVLKLPAFIQLLVRAMHWVEGFANMMSLDPHNPMRQVAWLCVTSEGLQIRSESFPQAKEITRSEGRDQPQA